LRSFPSTWFDLTPVVGRDRVAAIGERRSPFKEDTVFEDDDGRTYKVVVNHEEQYSIWPADRDSPAGWREVGKEGTKAECLGYINEVWTDMRPLSLRQRMGDES
jgi:MbtH protein